MAIDECESVKFVGVGQLTKIGKLYKINLFTHETQ